MDFNGKELNVELGFVVLELIQTYFDEVWQGDSNTVCERGPEN